jgi:hypothetical protein
VLPLKCKQQQKHACDRKLITFGIKGVTRSRTALGGSALASSSPCPPADEFLSASELPSSIARFGREEGNEKKEREKGTREGSDRSEALVRDEFFVVVIEFSSSSSPVFDRLFRERREGEGRKKRKERRKLRIAPPGLAESAAHFSKVG